MYSDQQTLLKIEQYENKRNFLSKINNRLFPAYSQVSEGTLATYNIMRLLVKLHVITYCYNSKEMKTIHFPKRVLNPRSTL